MLTLFPFQVKALETLRHKEVHLALTAPTGAGKGAILEELAADPDERILLLTPLLALGRQQIARFSACGISCHSSMGKAHTSPNRSRVWISSPESALTHRNQSEISEWKPTLIAVDEAHCLHEWGEHFRPAYLEIVPFLKRLAAKRSLWMSATFPRQTIDHLMNEIPGRWQTQGTFVLPANLSIRMERIRFTERIELIHGIVKREKKPGILFAGTRKNVEKYHRLFASAGMKAIPYHAGMSDEERRSAERILELESETPLGGHSVIATNAFGMGMDYRQLEWALLAHTPFSILSLMQSFGRVARAGRIGRAELYWAEEDFRIAGYLSKRPNDLQGLRSFLEATPSKRQALLKELLL